MISPDQDDLILNILQKGSLEIDGQFMWGSNYTFLCDVTLEGETVKGVYKPVQGERPLWDFPSETLAGREVAAYLISKHGDWNLVPPTIYRKDGPSGAGSLQLFVDHDPEYHYFRFSKQDRDMLKPVALFDAVVNNTDRKGGHILVDPDNKFWLIDHGICFHAHPKLRTVVWDFADQPIPEESCGQIKSLREKLLPDQPLHTELTTYLSPVEIIAMIGRIDKLLKDGVFPRPIDKRYSYPWPPV